MCIGVSDRLPYVWPPLMMSIYPPAGVFSSIVMGTDIQGVVPKRKRHEFPKRLCQ
jgi:hypothetical protein